MNYTYNRQEMNSRAFYFIYGCAMHDAILQKAFKGDKKWVGKVDSAKNILSVYITKVLNNEFLTQEFPERYNLFQRAIRELIGCGDIFPIEFDYVEWKN